MTYTLDLMALPLLLASLTSMQPSSGTVVSVLYGLNRTLVGRKVMSGFRCLIFK